MADRIEKEIEEILRKIDDFVPEKPRSVRKRPADKSAPAFENPSRAAASRSSGTGGSLSRVSLNQVMGWSMRELPGRMSWWMVWEPEAARLTPVPEEDQTASLVWDWEIVIGS